MSNPQIKHAVELAEQWAIQLDRMADDARIIARRLAALDVPPPEPPKPTPPDVKVPDDVVRWG